MNYGADTGGTIVEFAKTASGYFVCYYDTQSKATKVQFPTWTTKNGQDDLIWHTGGIGTRHNSRVFYYNVEKSEHNYEAGTHTTHIYVDGKMVDGSNYTIY